MLRTGAARGSIVVLTMAVLFSLARAQVSPGPLGRAHRDLEGNAKCMSCHASRKDGMNAKCLECHREIASLREARRGFHAKAGEATCASCHPEHAGEDFELIEWPGGSAESFDHAHAGWPLRGRHAAITCRGCHQARYLKGEAAALARVKDPGRSFVGLETACASCHADSHRGALGADCAKCHGFEDWKKTTRFDHATTAYPLTGKHAAVACAKCHQKDAATAPVYRPLAHDECSACHTDVHSGRLGAKCVSCHATTSFRDVAKSAFDHDRTRYPLRGAHRPLPCARCHDAKTAWGAKPRFAACVDCHRDPHAGLATLAGAAVDCAACHSVDGFRPGVLAAARHAPRSFPLEGKHAEVACGKCHARNAAAEARARLGPAAVEMRPPYQRCDVCHADAHAGQLATATGGGECERCHSAAGWKPARFTAEQHRSLALPLEGAHAKARCSACHGSERPGLSPLPAGLKVGTARVALRGIERDCAGCHRDPHRFESSPACTSCHDAIAFSPARYGPAEHAKAAFALEGAHRAVPCFACHKDLESARAASTLVHGPGTPRALPLQVDNRACVDCHADPHGGQFTVATGARPTRACEACHDASAFRPAARFDHDRDTAFRLGRAHATVACARCHPLGAGSGSMNVRIYRGAKSRCEDCHGPKANASGGRP